LTPLRQRNNEERKELREEKVKKNYITTEIKDETHHVQYRRNWYVLTHGVTAAGVFKAYAYSFKYMYIYS